MDARGFYGVIVVSVVAGLAIQYSPISPMKALFWSAVINGVVAVPLVVVVILLASSRAVMGSYASGRTSIALACFAALLMGGAAIGMLLPG
jgi:Mn2+/Fe2+ NRAMP family transporter